MNNGLLQQTLFINVEDITECIEKDEEENDVYVQTNFDTMVSDFCTDLIETGHVILGKTFAITEKRIYAIIQYMERPDENKIHAVKGILSEGM